MVVCNGSSAKLQAFNVVIMDWGLNEERGSYLNLCVALGGCCGGGVMAVGHLDDRREESRNQKKRDGRRAKMLQRHIDIESRA